MKKEISRHLKKKIGYWPVQLNGNKFATDQILRNPIEVVKKGGGFFSWLSSKVSQPLLFESHSQDMGTAVRDMDWHTKVLPVTFSSRITTWSNQKPPILRPMAARHCGVKRATLDTSK
jgi:hypothetical protein